MALSKVGFFDAIGYVPHSEAQWSFHRSSARFRVAVCGRRFGKSEMAAKDEEPELIDPSNKGRLAWIVGPTYDLADKEFRVIWNDLIVGRKLGLDKRVKKLYNKRSGDMVIDFPWAGRLEVRSAAHPETLVGDSLDKVIVSEAAKHNSETWERFLRPALADRRGTADFPTTPEGHNWLYLLWQMGKDPKNAGIYESWNFPSWLNRIVYPGGRDDPEILLLERTMSNEQFLQEIAADFSSFTGKIYSEFNENTHVKAHTFNPNWPNYISFDWGFTAPLAAIEFQIDPWDNIYVWREHYRSYLTLDEHLEILRKRDQPPGYRIDCCYGDAADPEAALNVTMKFAPCIADPRAKGNWREGVDLVKRFLKMYQIGEADEFGTPLEAPKLFVDHSCGNLIREFNTYRKRETASVVKESGAAGAAQRQDDHALDALRYGLTHIFICGATHHLADVLTPSASVDRVERVEYSDSGYFTTGKSF